jgi:hypothetical protein
MMIKKASSGALTSVLLFSLIYSSSSGSRLSASASSARAMPELRRPEAFPAASRRRRTFDFLHYSHPIAISPRPEHKCWPIFILLSIFCTFHSLLKSADVLTSNWEEEEAKINEEDHD